MGMSGGQSGQTMSEINVTPLVDVMLVLLIIFMVASSYIVENSIEVELPTAASGGDTLDTTLSFKLSKEGKVFMNGEPAEEAAIAERCKPDDEY